MDLEKALDVPITIKVRQTVAFRTDCDPHEVQFVDGDALDEDGFYFRCVLFYFVNTLVITLVINLVITLVIFVSTTR